MLGKEWRRKPPWRELLAARTRGALEGGKELEIKPHIVETDCAEAIDLIKECNPNTSIHTFRKNSIKKLI